MLLSFLAMGLGALTAPLFGSGCVVLSLLLVSGLTSLVLRVRGLRGPGYIAPLVVLVALSALYRDLREEKGPIEDWPQEAFLEPREGRVRLEVKVTKVIRRDPVTTSAEALVSAYFVPGRGGGQKVPIEPKARRKVIVNGPGLIPLISGATYLVYGRLSPPPPSPEAIGPFWPRQHRGLTLQVSKQEHIIAIHGSEGSAIDRFRFRISTVLCRSLEGDGRALALAVLLGEGHGIEPGLRRAMSRIGTAHLLAVSGLHVVMVASLLAFFFVGLTSPLLVRLFPSVNLALAKMLVALLAATAVLLLSSAPPSASRAAGMLGVFVVSRLIRRPQDLLSSLCLAGCVNIFIAPEDVTTLSFILSYSAVFGIATLAPMIESSMTSVFGQGKLSQTVARALAVSLGAFLSTSPTTTLAFSSIGLLAPLTNLLAVPFFGLVVMPLYLFLGLLSALWGEVPVLLAKIATFVTFLFLAPQRWLASLMPEPGPYGLLLAFVLEIGVLVALLTRACKTRWGASLAFGAIGAGLAFLLSLGLFTLPPSALQVTFLDVGKGDAILVRCPTGKTYLVDTGESKAFHKLLYKLASKGVTSLDGVIVTHSDADHSGGLSQVLEAFNVPHVAGPCQELFREPLRSMWASSGVNFTCLALGMEAFPSCGVDSQVLWPSVLAPVQDNDASLVIRVRGGKFTLLLTGDLEREMEGLLVARLGERLKSDVLKLGHHGSKHSSTKVFLEAVRPRVAIASGLVSKVIRKVPGETMERLSGVKALLFSTLSEGDVRVTFGENVLSISGKAKAVFLTPHQ